MRPPCRVLLYIVPNGTGHNSTTAQQYGHPASRASGQADRRAGGQAGKQASRQAGKQAGEHLHDA